MPPGGHAKFLFDRDFEKDEEEAQLKKAAEKAAKAAKKAAQEAEEEAEANAAIEPEAPPPPSFSEQDLERAREEGRAQGRDEATQDMAGAIEQRTVQTLEALGAQMAQLFQMYELDKEQHSRDAVAVAEVIVRKLFPAINMDKALSEIEHMIVEAMKRTSGSPMLIVRVAEDMQGEVEARAQEIAALRGREGTVSIIGDPDVAPGDARVEWDGGGMVRDTGLIWREIDDIIERNLGERLEMPEDAPDAPSRTEEAELSEAEVVNPTPVGDNEETTPESPEFAAGQDLPEPHPGPETTAEEAEMPQETAPVTDDAAPETTTEDTDSGADADASDQDETNT